MLGRFEAEARLANARNLWVCGSSFNDPALSLYESVGFGRVALLDDLLVDGFDEVLMRKRLAGVQRSGR